MSILDNIGNRLFKRESKNSAVGVSNKKAKSYTSLFNRDDNEKVVPYKVGIALLRDIQLGTGFDILKYLLSSKKWILTNTEEEDTEVYDFIYDMIMNMNIEMQELVKQMTPAMLWGFTVHEKLFDVNNEGRIVIKDVVPIHIKTLQNYPFTFDEATGELVSIHQQVDNVHIEIPIDKCVLYSYNSLYDEKQGHGLFHDFLPIIEDKDNLKNWLMTFAERNGAPTMYGKAEDEVSSQQMLYAFDDIADGTVGLTVGLQEDVGVLESSHNGEVFFNGLNYNDNLIFRRMFIGNLIFGDPSQTGSYAQSQTQLEAGSMVFDGILEERANVIQRQIINPIVEFNFGPERKAPVFSFDKFTSGDMQKLFTILQPLMTTGVVDTENSAVHEALALLFKTEAGVEYVNEEEVSMPEENFDYQASDVSGETLTDDILSDLDGITG